MILLSLAVAHAISTKARRVVYGAHAGDHAIYPDCRPEFVDALDRAVHLCDFNPPLLEAPFIHKTKAQICQQGAEEDAPLELSYSCYEGKILHCGVCGTCCERREAFKIAGMSDPTVYAGAAK